MMTTEAQIVVSPIENLVKEKKKSCSENLKFPISCLDVEHLPLMPRAAILKDIAEALLQHVLLVISDLMLQLVGLVLPLKTGCNGAPCHGRDLFKLSHFQN